MLNHREASMVVTITLTDGETFAFESGKSAHAVANDIAAHQLFFEVHTEAGIVYINPRQVVSVREAEA
ncbi:MAG TPA: hypothetical protein VMS63_01935 [Gaiellaceae bacterium]|nr:hypothetical protein [Gaiellaceae bacterium]